MIVVLPFHAGDVEQLRNLLNWIGELGGVQTYNTLLVADAGVNWGAALDLLTLANKTFRSATIITNELPVTGWIAGANSLFFTAAENMENNQLGPWLWMEPDAIPLSQDWLVTIATEYEKCGKPFMGHIYGCQTPGLPTENLSGIAVYPQDAFTRLKPWRDSPLGFDVACAYVTVPEAHHTPLIQHLWGEWEGNLAPTFVVRKLPTSERNTMTLSDLKPGSVVFHRNKDGTLISILRRKLHPEDYQQGEPPCFVQLGRFGDLILLLPAFKEWFDQTGIPPRVVSSFEFGTVLEGVSYVRPLLRNINWHFGLKQAANSAAALYPNVIVTQLHGDGFRVEPDSLPSYSMTMWARTGVDLGLYEKLPVVFDRRRALQEKQLINRFVKHDKPLLLVNFDSYTSPLHECDPIKRFISQWGSEFQILNTHFVRADRVFDLLGLFDIAAGLITIDTMTLHLASASKIPYVALVRNDGQSGSIPKGNCVLKIGYGEMHNRFAELESVLDNWAGITVAT